MVVSISQSASSPSTPFTVTWEKLPDDYVLDDEPVDNIYQPPIAAALTESLENAGLYPANALITTNYGICATVNDQLVIKAPDWSYVRQIQVAREEIQRSYTPQLQGEIPAVVMEFLSNTEGSEYSVKPTFPPGKWFFYEQILQVPNYVIFQPDTGAIEFYRRNESGNYQLQTADESGQYWLPEMNLFLGTWQGDREQRLGYWLRWWDDQKNLLLWGKEAIEAEHQQAEVERQRAEAERQRAEAERQRADRLLEQLRAAGIEPEA
jgi:Uma2 family endonuclease